MQYILSQSFNFFLSFWYKPTRNPHQPVKTFLLQIRLWNALFTHHGPLPSSNRPRQVFNLEHDWNRLKQKKNNKKKIILRIQ